ncbi:MAG: hypothetical protein AYP45_13245 [Candidatus Brocadia carolinensis]|uniref:Uncharacterized protein n=1 Tax=Candidatus Brocadia carolinensis TaxID=1004156 RepID=A0A1V4ARG3_9BACT|nr:MAG: hypothetical protein AYP45_13245 [Candidatus Brocadia caroliniensis]
MSKINKIFVSIQILIFLSLTLCSSGVTFVSQGKSGEFPCKGHACGCKSATDCMSHCCCSPQGNSLAAQQGIKKQKDSIQSFISSLKCKSGSDTITFTNAELKYTLEDDFVITRIKFFCFLANDTQVHLCEPPVSPPEKPPRCSA